MEFVSNSYMAGDILVIQCNIRDVTERKKLELIKETKRLLQEERMKLESIADATHELRTPLAIIKGNVDLAMMGVDKNPKSAKSAFKAIDYEVKHLSAILSDLTLITSKAWELKNRIIYEKVSLKSLINICIARSIPLAYKKNIKIYKKNVLDLTIVGDRVYLEKMLVNLLKNSVIYGNNNGKTIITTNKSKGFVTIDVIDTGIGISKEDLPHVFERFYRADKVRNISVNSVGLGLAIVKWIAEIHGGSVHVKNNKGVGSTFSVLLPIDKSSK